jgi:hypothetical protein
LSSLILSPSESWYVLTVWARRSRCSENVLIFYWNLVGSF